MAKDLTFKEFESLNENLTVDKNGHTNKQCPCCGTDVVIEHYGSSYTMKCATKDCISLDFRGI